MPTIHRSSRCLSVILHILRGFEGTAATIKRDNYVAFSPITSQISDRSSICSCCGRTHAPSRRRHAISTPLINYWLFPTGECCRSLMGMKKLLFSITRVSRNEEYVLACMRISTAGTLTHAGRWRHIWPALPRKTCYAFRSLSCCFLLVDGTLCYRLHERTNALEDRNWLKVRGTV